MVAVPGPRSSSCNAGELSPLLAGRPDIKQYYSGGLAFKNFEPVPQSGFRLMPGSHYGGPVRGRLERVFEASNVNSDFFIDQRNVSAVCIDAKAERYGQAVFEAEINGSWKQMGQSFELADKNKRFYRAFLPGERYNITHMRIRALANVGSITISYAQILTENNDFRAPRYCPLKVDQTTSFLFSFQHNSCDIWRNKEHIGFLWIGQLSADLLDNADFYAEAATVGIFHENLRTIRLQRAGNDADWNIDNWPYENVPDVDYGLDYAKTEDQWAVNFRAQDNKFENFTMRITVDGENTAANFTGDWSAFANAVAAAINELPSINGGVHGWANSDWRIIWIGFGGKSLGQEFQFSCMVTSTSQVSALPSHTQIGKTGGEPIISDSRGWPATCGLMQDRIAYAGMRSQPAAQLLSQTGEYFNLNIKASGDNAARLDRLRTQTSEKIYQIKESKYFTIFTNEGVYFATNRVISRNEPLNYVNTCEIGIRKNTKPQDMEGLIYFVSNNGKEFLSMAYDDIATSYTAKNESLLATHLIEGINRSVRQIGATSSDTSRIWLLREDGRLICSNVIRDQDIIGFSEWCLAANGQAREIAVDGQNDLWVCAERDGKFYHSYMQQNYLFQETIETETDSSGMLKNLPFSDGTVLWAQADDYVLGPFNCYQGQVQLDKSYSRVFIGRWQRPYYESMPHIKILPNDEIVRRPGRIHTLYVNLINTTSLAVAANGQQPADVPLLTAADMLDNPLAAKSELKTVGFLLGVKNDTTLIISQTKPGRLQVRDYSVGEKL